jgi:hypothetical protein
MVKKSFQERFLQDGEFVPGTNPPQRKGAAGNSGKRGRKGRRKSFTP